MQSLLAILSISFFDILYSKLFQQTGESGCGAGICSQMKGLELMLCAVCINTAMAATTLTLVSLIDITQHFPQRAQSLSACVSDCLSPQIPPPC